MKIIKEFIRRFTEHKVTGHASQIAYFLLLSLFPFLMFLISLLGFLEINVSDALSVLEKLAPKETIEIIQGGVQDILTSRNTDVLSFSILATLWSASRGLNAIIDSLNTAYEVKESRNFFVKVALSVVFTIMVAFSFALSLIIPSFGDQFFNWITDKLEFTNVLITLWINMRWIIGFAIFFITLGTLYYFAPNKKLKWKSIIPGTIFASIGWTVLSFVFSIYVNNFSSYEITYGSLSTIIVLMLWFFLTGVVFMLGGEINSMVLENIELKSYKDE